jgi:hypothetical protein
VTDVDWRLYTPATDALKATGTSIDVACGEYAEARKLLGTTSLLEAVRRVVRHDSEQLVSGLVPEIVEVRHSRTHHPRPADDPRNEAQPD